MTASATGEQTFALASAVVQGWLDNPSGDQGIVFADTANTDGLEFYSRESTTRHQRPALNVRLDSVGTTPPETNIDSGPSGTGGSDSAAFALYASEGGPVFECSLDGTPYAACASPESYANLSNGAHTFEVRAKDGAVNTDATLASRTWTVQR